MIIEMILMNSCFTLTLSLSLRERGLVGYRFNLAISFQKTPNVCRPPIHAISNSLAPSGGEGWGEGGDSILNFIISTTDILVS